MLRSRVVAHNAWRCQSSHLGPRTVATAAEALEAPKGSAAAAAAWAAPRQPQWKNVRSRLLHAGARPRVAGSEGDRAWVCRDQLRPYSVTSIRAEAARDSEGKKGRGKVAFAFDIDGVLKAGSTILPAAKRALDILDGANKRGEKVPYIFITNGGGPSENDRARRLSEDFSRKVEPNQVVQAHTVLQSLTKRFGNKPILMIGGPDRPPGASRKVLESYGFEDVYTAHDVHAWAPSSWPFSTVPKEQEGSLRKADFSTIKFAAVLVFHDSRDWGRDLQYICDVLRSPTGTMGIVGDDTHVQPFLAFSHGDLVWGNDFATPRFGQGAFQSAVCAVYEQTSRRKLEATTFGKPQRLTYEYASALLADRAGAGRASASEALGNVWMVGDNPASDIQGANAFGWRSALVRTGVYRDVDGKPAHTPSIVVDTVEDAVQQALEREWGPNSV